MVFASCVYSDAGFLHSIVQNPVPLSSSHISIEMTSEDVLIEIYPGGKVEITAAFLFANTGAADTVIMYFPVIVRNVSTPGAGLSLQDTVDPLTSPSVTVNGLQVDVHPLIENSWLPQYEEYTWDEVREEVFTMQEAEPDTGEIYFYIAAPETWHTYDFIEMFYESERLTLLDELLLLINSLNACWTVPFSAGDSVLVEFSMEYSMSSGYENPYCTMIYPLFTGASWAGPIGEGRITAVPAGGLEFADFDSWYSVSMPDAKIVESLTYVPLGSISGSDGFALTKLADFSGTHLDSVLVWEFTEFEPVVSPTYGQYFYYTPNNPDGRFNSFVNAEDSTHWSSSLRIDVLDPLWVLYE